MIDTNKKAGLVLGSGSARGWAHIGVIEALMEEGIPVDCIAGVSIDPPDVLIQPKLGDLKLFDFDQAERSIKEGYIRTMEKMGDIKSFLSDLN